MTHLRRLENHGRVRRCHLCVVAHGPGLLRGPASAHGVVTMAPDSNAALDMSRCMQAPSAGGRLLPPKAVLSIWCSRGTGLFCVRLSQRID